MRWQAYIASALLSGCQAIQAFNYTTSEIEAAFLNMWRRHSHCRSRTDVNHLWLDAQKLNRTVRLMDQDARAARLLPDTIEETLTEPSPRLAMDPKAMAAACTFLVGQAAQNMGHSQFAAEMFSFVLSNFSQPRYAYYRKQAQRGLDQIEGIVADLVVMMFDRQPYWPK